MTDRNLYGAGDIEMIEEDVDTIDPASPRSTEVGVEIVGGISGPKITTRAVLEEPAAAQVWQPEVTQMTDAVRAIRARLNEPSPIPTAREVIDTALTLGLTNAAIPTALNAQLEASDSIKRRREITDQADRELVRAAAARLTTRALQLAPQLRALVADEAELILADATDLAARLDGVDTPEAAMSTGLSEPWLARAALPDRWMAVQRSRTWLTRVQAAGFDPRSTATIDRLADETKTPATGKQIWAAQFESVKVAETATAQTVLDWYISRPAKKRPRPII